MRTTRYLFASLLLLLGSGCNGHRQGLTSEDETAGSCELSPGLNGQDRFFCSQGIECDGEAGMRCGPRRRFDDEGCLRRECRAHSDCAGEQRCYLPSLHEGSSCVSSGIACHEDLGTCQCGESHDCNPDLGWCIAASDLPG